MQLSDRTISVLKNFATINPSLLFPAGSVLKTLSPQRNILGQANVEEAFDSEFAIYDLNQFLGVVSLFEQPDFDIQEHSVKISNGSGHTSNYFFADKEMIEVPPDKNLAVDGKAVVFQITESDLKSLLQAAHVMQLPNIVVEVGKERTLIKATDNTNSTSNTYDVVVDCETYNSGYYIFATENLKFIPATYTVTITEKGLAYFESKDQMVQYWVATEQGSKTDD
jgi:hypothetical protein